MLGELDQDPASRFRVKKGDPPSAGALDRQRVQQAISLRREESEHRVEIVDRETKVVDSRPAPGQKSRDRRIPGRRLEKLDPGVAGREKSRADLLRRHLFTSDLPHSEAAVDRE